MNLSNIFHSPFKKNRGYDVVYGCVDIGQRNRWKNSNQNRKRERGRSLGRTHVFAQRQQN